MNEGLADFLRGIAATNEWWYIIPEILLAVLALGLLVLELLSPAIRKHVPRVAMGGLGLILALLLMVDCSDCMGANGQSAFGGLLQSNEWSHLMRVFFVFSALMVSYLGGIFLAGRNLAQSEFYHLVILVAAAMMLLVQSNHFVMLFVALEMATVAFYVLVAYRRTSSLSLEAGIKYLILGALSSSILLFGIVLLYGAGGNPALPGASGDSLNFDALESFIALNPDNPVVLTGAMLVLAGICFKIGAVPFQIWVPDVYQGAPNPVTAYLAIASKAAGFMVLLSLLHGPFLALQDFLLPVLVFIAAASILFGNIAAVMQRNLKRLLGLSGIAHAGYLLIGVAASFTIEWVDNAVVFYLITYLLASFVVFLVLSLSGEGDDADLNIERYANFSREQPFLSGALTCGLGSLAGIPPMGGFVAKLLLFVAAFQAGLYGLLGVAVLGVVISVYYYFGWIRALYFNGSSVTALGEASNAPTLQNRFVLCALVVAIVVLGIFPAVVSLV